MPTGIYQRAPRKQVEKTCSCGQKFLVWPYRLKTAKYCSKSCLGRGTITTKITKKATYVERICLNCGDKFTIIGWRLTNPKRGKFCSYKCRQFARGTLASNWQNGVTAQSKKVRISYLYRQLKQDLLSANPKCSWCDGEDRLELDHIIPISLHPEGLYDRDNVQLLCYDCHKRKTKGDMQLIYAARRTANA